MRPLMSVHLVQADRLLEEWGLEIQIHGITDSKWMLLSYEKLDLSCWQSALDKQVRESLVPTRKLMSSASLALHFDETGFSVIGSQTVKRWLPCPRRQRRIWTPSHITLPAFGSLLTRSL